MICDALEHLNRYRGLHRNLYPNLKEKYNIMSVPCLIINDDEVHFGKKSVSDLLDIFQA